VVGSCEHNIEALSSMKGGGKFLACLAPQGLFFMESVVD
jgi:hypothetical protein